MVVSYAGAEQEYFLIDKNFFYARPDLLNAGRTLVRRQAAQGSGVRGSLLRRDPRARAGVHDGGRARAVQARRAGQDPPQRGRARPVRGRAGVRERQPRHRSPAAGDVDVEDRRREARPGLPACTRSRSPASTARASTSTSRSATATQGNLLDPGDTPHDNAQFLVFCGAVIRAVHKYVGRAARGHRDRQQRSPPRRQRSPARDHLDLPRRAADRRVRADQGRRREVVEDEGHAGDRRRHAAEAADGRGRPQPHQPVRLHRQPLRVPRRRLGAVDQRSADRAQHHHRRVVRLRRHQAREPRSAAARS